MTLIAPAKTNGLFVPPGMFRPSGGIPIIQVLSRRAGATAGTSATVTMSGQGAAFGTVIVLASCAKTAGTMTSPSVGTITDTSGASPVWTKQYTGTQLSDGTSSVYSEVWSGNATFPSTSFSVTVPFNGSPDIVFVELLAVLNCNPLVPFDRNINGPYGKMFSGGTTNTTPQSHTVTTDAPNVMAIGHAFGNQGGNFGFTTSQLTGGTDNRNSGNFNQTGGAAGGPTNGVISGTSYSWGAQGTEVWQDFFGFLVPSGGGNDANTILLAHMEGTNGGTTFADSSSSPKTLTPIGSAQMATGTVKFGSAALSIPVSTVSALLASPSGNFNFGSGDFTIDFWLYITGTFSGQNYYLISKGSSTTGVASAFSIYAPSNTAMAVYMSSNGTSWDMFAPLATMNVSTGTWHHVALVRSGNNFALYLDGASQGTGTSSASIYSNTNSLSIGDGATSTTSGAGFLIDEFRVSNMARWTTSFTPPTGPYY